MGRCQFFVDFQVVTGHVLGSEALLEFGAHLCSIQGCDPPHRPHRLLDSVDNDCRTRCWLQTAKKRPLVGWLYYSRNDLAERYLGLVLDGMRELGDIEGRDFEMVYTSADGHVERLPKAAEELVQLNSDNFCIWPLARPRCRRFRIAWA
jgi:hypothetical protein